MSSDAQVRADWLTYCRQVVGDCEHLSECGRLGGSKAAEGFPSDVRWPGYLGPGYRPGGVLWMANIHRNFDSAGMDAHFAERAAGAVRAITAGGDDQAFLDAMTDIYCAGLARWAVAHWGRKVLSRLGVGLDEIAYLNAARCQSTGTGEQLQRSCQARWPVRATVAMLRPRLLLITSLTALTAAGSRAWPCTVVGFSQRNGRLVLTSPWKPRSGNVSPSVWIDELAAFEPSRRSNPSASQ